MIKNVEVIKGCISCRNCETVCPDIFRVDPKSKVISHEYEGRESEILQAELMCPVNVIKVQKKGNFTLSFKEAILQEKNMLNPDVMELKFQTQDFSFKPGQYISLQLKDSLGKFSRCYSIAQGGKDYFILNIKLLHKGRGSTYLKKFGLGKKISFLGALGNFYLQKTEARKVFIATGTGLAPMISMLQALPKQVEKVVIFGVRFEKEIYYKEILESFQNIKIIITVSQPGIEYHGEKGRVIDHMSEIKGDDEIYICGNPAMVDSVSEYLGDKGHSKDTIFKESFVISRQYPGMLKDIFLNGNIPFLNHFSWFIMIVALFVIPLFWGYHSVNKSLYVPLPLIGMPGNFLWDLSWWSVVFVMGIRPLGDLLPKFGILRRLNHLRRSLGILSASIIVTAFLGKFIGNPSLLGQYFNGLKWDWYLPLFARISEITGVILLVTSNNISQKVLGTWWKKIQRLSYLYFITGGIVAAVYTPLKIYPALGIVIFLWILAQIKNT